MVCRSLLFVPGDSESKLEKSLGCDADIVIFDLEDSVSFENKPNARTLTANYASRTQAKPVYVRVNALDTGLTLEDLKAVMPAKPDGVMLPKCRGAVDVEKVAHWLEAFEVAFDIPLNSTRILPIVTETADSVMNLGSYAKSNPRVWGLLWGAEDLAGDIGASMNREAGAYRTPFRWVREQFLLAAKSAQLAAIDAVYVDVRNAEGLKNETENSRIDGFDAKAAIHPAQCTIINAAFAPSVSEVNWARQVISALEATHGSGVTTINGQMIDKPHISQARKILSRLTESR